MTGVPTSGRESGVKNGDGQHNGRSARPPPEMMVAISSLLVAAFGPQRTEALLDVAADTFQEWGNRGVNLMEMAVLSAFLGTFAANLVESGEYTGGGGR